MTAEQKFLKECNGNRTIRTFGPQDYQAYKKALKEAKEALRLGEPYYASDHAGIRTADFRYPAETATWGVWILNGTVKSEYGSRAIVRDGGRLQYDEVSYLDAWEHREWTSPAYSVGHDLDVHILAHWRIRDGLPFGRGEMALASPAGRPVCLPARISEVLPEKLQKVLKGITWNWPQNVSADEAESIVLERAEKIAELLPALTVILVST